ncbi:MAG: MATE family efflux transporter [Clostridia bacterium]|nr:MATE family efflux transporter [Clostridia bacterium]MBQ9774390.1 MATE family efflux transporter [Clostridia bacterium]
MLRKRYIGTRHFYRTLLAVAIPIIVQNGITNFISLLDNVMVGQVGTEQMSGVSIVNQLLFVFNLCIFGALSGVGLFSAQFFGKRDHEGVRYTFRFKLFVSVALCAVAILLFFFAGDALISLYLHEGDSTGDTAMTLLYAKEYLGISLLGLLPYTLTQIYASTLREIGHTLPPMNAGLAGVGVNLILNYLLIFGAFGFPEMGVSGAAIATVIARFIECIAVVLWTHTHPQKCEFIKGVYHSFRVPRALVKSIAVTGTPLLINETMWAAGQAMLLQCYSLRGIAAVSAMNISTTVFNTFSVIYLSIGTAISILIGHRLGAGENDLAMEESRKMIAFGGLLGVLSGLLIAACAPFFPRIYNTSAEIQRLATYLTLIVAAGAPIHAILNSCYFTLRSGGKTVITFLFDSGYVWGVNLPVAFLLSRFSPLSTAWIYLICQSTELIKWVIGILLVEKGVWLNDITKTETNQQELQV